MHCEDKCGRFYSKRTYYLYGDSWAALASDEFDARGQLYLAGFAFITPSDELPAPCADMRAHCDLVNGIYALSGFNADTGAARFATPLAEHESNADSLAGAANRWWP